MHYLKSLKRGRLLVAFHRKENSGSKSFPAPGMDGNDRTRIWELSDSNQGLQTPSTSVVGYTFFLDDIRSSPSFLEDCGLPSALVVWKWFWIFSLILVYLEQVSFLWVSNGLIKLILLLWKSVLSSRRTLIFQKKGDIESAQPHS